MSEELKGFKGRLLKEPQKGPGPEEAPSPPTPPPRFPIHLLWRSPGAAGQRGKCGREQLSGRPGGQNPAGGVGPEVVGRGRVGGVCVVSAGKRSWGGMGLGRKELKVGPSLQTRAHIPYSDLVTRVSLALNRESRVGDARGLGPCRLHLGLHCPALGGRGPHCLNSHLRSPLSYALTGSNARAHTSDIPIVPHVTHGPERAHPSHTLTHACTQAHIQTRPLPNSIPTATRSPTKALIDCDTPTLIHRHTHTPTHANHRHIHKQGQEKYTGTPLPSLLFWEP